MSKAWGGIGAWAAEAERAEEEERAAAAAMPPPEPQGFPSLKESATVKPKKKKMTLTEFYSVGAGGGAASSKGLTPNEMLQLPKGPKERSAEEMQHGRLGGGFSSYGRGPPGGRERDEGGSSWGGGGRRSYGGFDDEGRGGPSSRVSDFDQPSRADEVDNWASMKKPLPSSGLGRPSRYDSLGGGGGGGGEGGGGSSRADDADNWTLGKKPQFQSPAPARVSSFSSGFRDSRPEPDRWSRGEPLPSERPKLVLAPPKEIPDSVATDPAKPARSNPFGAARPREQVLAEKGLDYKQLDLDIEAKKTSRPTSASSSRPASAQSGRSESAENLVKPRPRSNPFGDAKPREVLLEEKGIDWRKIDLDLEHRRVDRPETEQEKMLKKEIETLKLELEKEVALKGNTESLQGSEEDQTSLSFVVSQKERELELMTRDLDDKVLFGQKATERPVSRGSVGSFSERPHSRSSSIDESHTGYRDRPPSRGAADGWPRQSNERRSFQGSKDRGFFPNRELDRTSSRPRW